MRIEEKYGACLEALADYVAAAGFSDVVLGLSGGIDSSVVAALCVDAFGIEHVHGYLLPGPYSTGHSVDDARDLAANLGIQADIISILEPYEAFENVLSKACGGSFEGLASENTQARCRMVCLMALSNRHGWMLVNTGNKSEAMMGYSTLYGDTAGAFAPLGGLYKTDVYAVGRYANEKAQAEGRTAPIPEHVFTKPPSAELSPGQQDEKSMGIDYVALDQLLIGYYEQGKSVEELAVLSGRDTGSIQGIFDDADRFAFKRAMEPPFPSDPFYA